MGKGLEYFYTAIENIKEQHRRLSISKIEIFLPKGKKFSYYPDGSRRICAVVKICRDGNLKCVVIEIGRVFSWSVSTLIIYVKGNNVFDNELEHLVEKATNFNINNNGH